MLSYSPTELNLFTLDFSEAIWFGHYLNNNYVCFKSFPVYPEIYTKWTVQQTKEPTLIVQENYKTFIACLFGTNSTGGCSSPKRD